MRRVMEEAGSGWGALRRRRAPKGGLSAFTAKATGMLSSHRRKGPAALALAAVAAGLLAAKRRRTSAANEPLEPNLPVDRQKAGAPEEKKRARTA